MTLTETLNEVYDRLQLGSSPPAAVTTRLTRYLNRWHRQLLSAPLLRSVRQIDLTFASVADTFEYAIGLEEIHHLTERDTNRRLVKRDEPWWRRHFPDPTNFSGTPDAWAHLGTGRKQRRPSNASELFVISTSASDTGTARVSGVRTGGHLIDLSVTMTGVTGVSMGSAYTDVEDFTNFYLSAAAVGTVTLREDSGTGTVLSTIPIGQSSPIPNYLRFALIPTPSAAITYYARGTAAVTDLANGTDRWLLPDDFHDILVRGAVYEDWVTHGRLKDAQWIRDEIRSRVMELRMWTWNNYVQDEDDRPRVRTFEDTISLPIT